MKRQNVTLESFQKRSLYFTLAILWLSGAAWLFFQYLSHPGAEIIAPEQTLSLKIHGAAAMVFLLVLGALLPVHVRMAWNQNRNRVAGAWLLGLNAFLILTGWMLYYVGSERLRPSISAAHWIIGLGLPLFVYLHIRLARKYPAK